MSILSPELIEKLKKIQINPAAQFQNGEGTSAFSDNNNQSSEIADIQSQVISEGVTYISSQVLSYNTDCVKTMTSTSFMSELPSLISYHTANNIKKPSDIAKEASSGPKDKEIQKQEEENSKKEQEKFMSDTNEKVSKMNETVDKIISGIEPKLTTLSSYITQGPDWVEQQISLLSKATVDNASKDMSKTVEDCEKSKKEWLNKTAEKQGKQAAEKTNKQAVESQKENIKKSERGVKNAQNKALASAQQIIMKLIGLLGA